MNALITPFLELLKEIYTDSGGEATFIIDRNPGHGLIAAIRDVSAADASKPIFKNGTTIAAHTGHITWSLQYAMEFYKGKTPQWDWKDSWHIHEVNPDQWQQLQQELTNAYNAVVKAINTVPDWENPMLLKGTLALLPHAAYHLGAIKQLMLAAKNKK